MNHQVKLVKGKYLTNEAISHSYCEKLCLIY